MFKYINNDKERVVVACSAIDCIWYLRAKRQCDGKSMEISKLMKHPSMH